MIAGSRPASAPTAVAASRPSIAAATGNAGNVLQRRPEDPVQGKRAHQRHGGGDRDEPGQERGDDALQHDRGEHPSGGGAETAPDPDLPDPLSHSDQPDVEHPERAEEQHQQPGAADDPAQGVLELLLVAGILRYTPTSAPSNTADRWPETAVTTASASESGTHSSSDGGPDENCDGSWSPATHGPADVSIR